VHVIICDVTVFFRNDRFCLHIHHMVEQTYQQFIYGAFCTLCHFAYAYPLRGISELPYPFRKSRCIRPLLCT
jgi:hypothetical protein